MAARKDGNIADYFQNKDASSSTPKPQSSKAATVKSEMKDNGKRPISSPSPAPAEKRQDTKGTETPQRKHLSYKDLPSDWLSSDATSATDRKLELTYHIGDMFADAPKNCLLIHACNTQGHWGAGIAKAFKDHYPKAYKAHHNFCAKEHSKTNPVPTGTTQLLAPVDGEPQHWIGCVFTSAKYGKAKDKPSAIVKNTGLSMEMLLELVKLADQEEGGVMTIRMCKINSGKFGVPWEKTEDVLKGIKLRDGWRGTIEVWEP